MTTEMTTDISRLIATIAIVAIEKVENSAGDVEAAERLRRYWAHGEGAAKIGWGTPGDFDRCVAHVGKYMKDPQGYCNLRHHEALGYYPATHAAMERGHKGYLPDATEITKMSLALLEKVGPKGYVHGWVKVGEVAHVKNVTYSKASGRIRHRGSKTILGRIYRNDDGVWEHEHVGGDKGTGHKSAQAAANALIAHHDAAVRRHAEGPVKEPTTPAPREKPASASAVSRGRGYRLEGERGNDVVDDDGRPLGRVGAFNGLYRYRRADKDTWEGQYHRNKEDAAKDLLESHKARPVRTSASSAPRRQPEKRPEPPKRVPVTPERKAPAPEGVDVSRPTRGKVSGHRVSYRGPEQHRALVQRIMDRQSELVPGVVKKTEIEAHPNLKHLGLPNAHAANELHTGTIHVRHDVLENSFERQVQHRRAQKSGLYSPGSKHHHEHTIDHELGHSVAEHVPQRDRHEALVALAASLGIPPPTGAGMTGADKWVEKNKAKLQKAVSVYGVVNSAELLAEIWAEYSNGSERDHINAAGNVLRAAANRRFK